MAGGTALVSAIAGGLGAGAMAVGATVAEGTKSKKENAELREKLRNSNQSNATKQQIIKELNLKLNRLRSELEAEKKKNNKSQEKIASLEEQIEDIIYTIREAR